MIVVAIIALVLLGAVAVFATLRNRQADEAVGITGKQVEKAAALEWARSSEAAARARESSVVEDTLHSYRGGRQ